MLPNDIAERLENDFFESIRSLVEAVEEQFDVALCKVLKFH